MSHDTIIIRNWIKDLNGFGVYAGPQGQPLESMSFGEIRSLVVQQLFQRNLDTLSSPWF